LTQNNDFEELDFSRIPSHHALSFINNQEHPSSRDLSFSLEILPKGNFNPLLTRPKKMTNSLHVIYCLFMILAAIPTLQAEQQLRIVTFNAQCLAAPGTRATRIARFRWDAARQAHLERVANVIETLNPDVLNLIEVTSVEAVDALVTILHEKGLDAYRGYHEENKETFSGFDVALITKIPPDVVDGKRIRCVFSESKQGPWRETYQYTDSQGKTHHEKTSLGRNAIYFLTVGRHQLGFLGLHLKSNPSDQRSNARRTAEAMIVRRIVEQEIVKRDYIPIVLGDLNDYDPDVPDRDRQRSTLTSVLAKIKNYDSKVAGQELVNVLANVDRMEDRYTSHWDRNENGISDTDDVFTMLDYILIHNRLSPHVRRVFICHSLDLTTSDHFPVVVDLELPD